MHSRGRRQSSRICQTPDEPSGAANRAWARIRATEVVHVIVDRFESPDCRIPQDLVDPPVLAFAGKQRAAHIERFLQRTRDLRQHRQHAGYVETADYHGNAGLTQRTREIERVGKLVRLHADKADHAKTVVVAE